MPKATIRANWEFLQFAEVKRCHVPFIKHYQNLTSINSPYFILPEVSYSLKCSKIFHKPKFCLSFSFSSSKLHVRSIKDILIWMWGFHILCGYEEKYLLGYKVVYLVESQQKFRWNTSPPSSGSKNKIRRNQHETDTTACNLPPSSGSENMLEIRLMLSSY
jgi:hypothetical protein